MNTFKLMQISFQLICSALKDIHIFSQNQMSQEQMNIKSLSSPACF